MEEGKSSKAKPNRKKEYAFLAMQFLGFGLFLLPIDLELIALPNVVRQIFFLFALAGGLLVLWAILELRKSKLRALPSPDKNAKLISTGPYRWFKHPIYSGIMLFLVAYSVFTLNVYKFCIAIVVYLVLRVKSRYEEKLLTEKFGLSYLAYAEGKLGV